MPLPLDRRRLQDAFMQPNDEIVETHISWVVLSRHDVWKFKRPVALGFLDFSTLERRRTACLAEVELNRRLAPAAYLGVVPITEERDGRLRVAGEGTLVDWAVHMRRLPDRDRADVRLAEGRLGEREIEAVAERLARFHAECRRGPDIDRFGTVDAIAINVHENFRQTRDTILAHVTEAEAREIEAAQLGILTHARDRFDRRIAAGRIRDGHGDLRLEHVYLADDGRMTVLDCIEFNERFRHADVAADLAFLAMDLSAHGRVDLSERLLAAYARATDDFDLYGVIDFYQGYRAYVRAKVSAMLAADPSVQAPTRAHAREQARRHFLLALACARRTVLEPRLVAVGGLIASGKSTIAERLAPRLAAPILDADRTRKHMLQVAPITAVHERAWRGAYDPAFSERVYEEILRRAAVVLESGRSVVLDASFRTRALRGRARALARRIGVPFTFIECRASPETCRARLEERARHATVSDGRLEIWDAFAAGYEPVDELDAHEHVIVDSERAPGETLDELEHAFSTWPKSPVP